MDIDGEAVALVGTLYRDRAALGIEVGEVQDLGWLIALRLDLTFERIMGCDGDDRARLDLEHGIDIGAVDIVEPTLLLDGERMTGPLLSARDAALRHDRFLDPLHQSFSSVGRGWPKPRDSGGR